MKNQIVCRRIHDFLPRDIWYLVQPALVQVVASEEPQVLLSLVPRHRNSVYAIIVNRYYAMNPWAIGFVDVPKIL